jgi:hypothetical protein
MTEIRIASASHARAGKARQSRPSRQPGTDVVVERDDGLFQIGLCEGEGPFPDRVFAQACSRERTLAICLLAAGANPNSKLECFRGSVLARRISRCPPIRQWGQKGIGGLAKKVRRR